MLSISLSNLTNIVKSINSYKYVSVNWLTTPGLEEPDWIIKKVHSLKYEDGYSFENGLVIEFTEDELKG